MESFNKEKLERLAKEIRAVVQRYSEEETLKYPELIGLLEMLKIGYIDELFFIDHNDKNDKGEK